ncbi:amino acid deaminase [Nocardia sp. NPDC051570]|uniref:amino acid deaminase n=1 Tax=Nocardia sp. NPDC051570 TaxID=3364324 RepID=UPI0037BB576C
MTIDSGENVERAGRIDTAAVAALGDRIIGPEHKALPPAAWGLTVREFLATAPHLDDLQTPVLTLDRGALDGNLAVLADWVAAAGVRLAPHGKTTMAPQLWAEQLAAGAWAITVATGWQAQVARSFGVNRIVLANAFVDPAGLRWAAGESALDPDFELISWVDSVETVAAMERHLADAPDGVRLPVLVELGGPHGRTGARGVDAALAVAEAVRGSGRLELAGAGGYEGVFAHDRATESLAAVHDYLNELTRLHRLLIGAYERRAIVSAGGSAYPDLVVEHLAPLADEQGAHGIPTTVVLRSGAYIIHDDGFYSGITPLPGLRSAMHAWARVLSHPEPALALLDAGKRDLPFDEGLPVPQRLSGAGGEVPPGAQVSALADQHTFLRLPASPSGESASLEFSGSASVPGGSVSQPGGSVSASSESAFQPDDSFSASGESVSQPGGSASPSSGSASPGSPSGRPQGARTGIAVGDIVRLGLSHPCTAMDKWRLVPVIDDADAERPRVVDLVHTFF